MEKVPLFREVFFIASVMVFIVLDNACRLPDKRSSETSSKDINLCKSSIILFFESPPC